MQQQGHFNHLLTMLMRAKIFILVVIAISFSALLTPRSAYAFTLIPPTKEFALSPGQTLTDVVRLYNETAEVITLYPSIERFTFKGEGGEPLFISGEDFGLPGWITINKEKVVLSPGERASVAFTVAVPKDAPPGGHYAAIFWSNAPMGAPGTTVSVVSKVGTLLIARISGAVVEKAGISAFLNTKRVYNFLPVSFDFKLANEGNVHLKPVGEISIKNLFGKEVARIPLNPKEVNVLPKQTRKFEVEWARREQGNFALGKFRAELLLSYGNEKKQSLVRMIDFWVLPARLIALSLFVLVFGAAVLAFGVRGYNHWIIKRYTKSNQKDKV